MQVVQFIADNPAAALAQIHERLGPNAVVLSVKPAAGNGVARLWHKRQRIEVVAGLPENLASGQTLHRLPAALAGEASPGQAAIRGSSRSDSRGCDNGPGNRWQSVSWLVAMGLLPQCADRLQAYLTETHSTPPDNLEAEWEIVSAALQHFWSAPPPISGVPSRPHVFIGPPGSGKTTALCKWLTLAVLTEERSARVCRLDGNAANTSEFLAIHCEMLGVPVDRFWTAPTRPSDLTFIDLPGTEIGDQQGLDALGGQLSGLAPCHVHLVLNAAYEVTTLVAQYETFAAFQPEDLILTHLDEEHRRVKLWNLVFGTNCSIRFLSAGQKVPGEFRVATPAMLFPS